MFITFFSYKIHNSELYVLTELFGSAGDKGGLSRLIDHVKDNMHVIEFEFIQKFDSKCIKKF